MDSTQTKIISIAIKAISKQGHERIKEFNVRVSPDPAANERVPSDQELSQALRIISDHLKP